MARRFFSLQAKLNNAHKVRYSLCTLKALSVTRKFICLQATEHFHSVKVVYFTG